MKKQEKNQLLKDAKELAGKRRNRTISELEINKMAKLDRKKSYAGKTIRVYSSDGFVANSYKYRADIDYIQREFDENGNKKFLIGQSSAQRSHGSGSLITINGRSI